MKASFFPALALDSIRKNRRLYLPYFLTCAGMVMMEYIITYLQFSETLGAMRGGSNIRMMMGFGSFVIALLRCCSCFIPIPFSSDGGKRNSVFTTFWGWVNATSAAFCSLKPC